MADKQLFVTSLSDLGDGEVKQVIVRNMCLAAYRVGEAVYVTSGVCTHGHALMADGYLDGYEIECPLHQGRFDIRTGVPMCAPVTVALESFPVEVVDGNVYLQALDGAAVERQAENVAT